MTSNALVLGVDIGGTKVAAGLVEPNGNIVFKTRQPMKATGTDREAMQAVHAVIRTCVEAAEATVTGIGVVSPGPLDIKTGTVLNPPNLPCWVNFPLAANIRNEYKIPAFIDNDANAAGLAEAIWGAGVGYKSVFYATVGTGIGTAIVLDGKLYYGRTGMAAEGGHITIDCRGSIVCGCGKPGCIEGIAAGPGIARRARQQVASVANAKLLQLVGGDADAITAHEVVEAWRTGDLIATDVITETMDALTVWFGNIIDLLEPDVIVVGGGLGSLVSEWFGYMRERLPKWSINPRSQEIPFLPAHFGVDAGIVGAAALCYASSV
jgi:glucokinase